MQHYSLVFNTTSGSRRSIRIKNTNTDLPVAICKGLFCFCKEKKRFQAENQARNCFFVIQNDNSVTPSFLGSWLSNLPCNMRKYCFVYFFYVEWSAIGQLASGKITQILMQNTFLVKR